MLFIQMITKDPMYFFQVCLIVIFSVTLHEFFHAWIAYREGDYTLEDHLTLNPLKQMGWMSLLMLAFMGIAWGVVPVNRTLLRSKHSMLKVAIAGPLANLLLLICAWLLFALLSISSINSLFDRFVLEKLILFVFLFGCYNLVLLTFNLIPAPGLDGWTILAELFPKLKNVNSELVKGVMMFLILLAFVGVPYLFIVGKFVMFLGPLLVRMIGG